MVKHPGRDIAAFFGSGLFTLAIGWLVLQVFGQSCAGTPGSVGRSVGLTCVGSVEAGQWLQNWGYAAIPIGFVCAYIAEQTAERAESARTP